MRMNFSAMVKSRGFNNNDCKTKCEHFKYLKQVYTSCKKYGYLIIAFVFIGTNLAHRATK